MRWISLVLTILVAFAGCAQTVALRPSSAVPAAEGEAKITRDSNNNVRVLLKVKHLASPKKLNPPKAVYVVWAETPHGRTINLGQLMVGKDRQGAFSGLTPLNEFRLLVTAEDLAAAGVPGQQVVLTTEVFRVRNAK